MPRENTKKVSLVTEKIEYDNMGEVIRRAREETYRLETEPPYVKLYLDTLCTFKGLSTTLNPILTEFLRYMSFADGGQVIYLNIELKKQIAASTKKTLKRIEQALTEFVKTGIFKRKGTSTYQVNPHLFGRGEWRDIKSIRATFDFVTGKVETDITRESLERTGTE
jgi:hypothetical protein